MANEAQTLRRLQRLAGRVREADTRASELRAELRHEMRAARRQGVTIAAMASAFEVTRQRIQQMLREGAD